MSEEFLKENNIEQEKLIDDLRLLTEIPSVSGNELKYSIFLKEKLLEYTTNVHVDSVGNVIAKKGTPKVYIFTHMDSIGFLVAAKEEERIKIISVKAKGGLPNDIPWKVQIDAFEDVIDTELNKPDEKGNMYINLSSSDLEKVTLGDFINIKPNFQNIGGGLVKSQGLDNKLGILAGIEAFKKLDNVGFVSTVQEETTGIGASKAAWDIKPEAVIVLDTTYDESEDGVLEPVIGGGPSICLKDSLFPDKKLVKSLLKSAEVNNIRYQFEVLDSGSSDANRVCTAHGYTPFVFLGIPIKNMHSPEEVGSMSDVVLTSNLLKETINNYYEKGI